MSRRAAVLLVLLAVGLTACARTGATSSTTTDITVTTVATSTTVDLTTTSTQLTTTPTTTKLPQGPLQITVADGQVTGGGRIPVTLDSTVTLVVEADSSDEVHLHGYDLSAPVSPGSPARIEFVADVPGVFELELEEFGLKLADLEVAP